MKSQVNAFHENHLVNASTDASNNMLKSASDFILLGMFIVMILCMALCCLCLFYRSSSRFTFCGFHFEINDRNPSVACDDLSELHEVVPLTPTTIGTYNIPDIETKLRGDPPPPKYSDVASPANFSMLERFIRKTKRRAASECDDKPAANSSFSSESSCVHTRGNNKQKDKQNRFYHSFRRSFSFQYPHSSNASASAKDATSLDDRPVRTRGFFSSLRPSLPHSASDCTFNTRSIHRIEEESLHQPSVCCCRDLESGLSLRNDVIHEESEPCCKASNVDLCDDDEVFL